MDGSTLGNLMGAGYFLGYQILGMLLSFIIWKKEELLPKLLLGSVFGSVLLHWMPVFTSFGMGFNKKSHIVAILGALVFVALCFFFIAKEYKSRREGCFGA